MHPDGKARPSSAPILRMTHKFMDSSTLRKFSGVFGLVVEMDSKDVRGFILEDKPVYDWNRFPIGTVSDLRRNPRTKGTRQVVVNLSAEAKTHLGTTDDLLEIPISYVCGIRQDAVSLDRSLSELRRIELLSGLIKR